MSGDIWLDISQFSGYQRAVGWPWDSLGVCYSAPVSAVNLDGNCIQASIYTQDNGSTRVYVPLITRFMSVVRLKRSLKLCSKAYIVI
ncbi:D-alanyl-D-alanine carboxypeptidase [Vibrio metschnikovii]